MFQTYFNEKKMWEKIAMSKFWSFSFFQIEFLASKRLKMLFILKLPVKIKFTAMLRMLSRG